MNAALVFVGTIPPKEDYACEIGASSVPSPHAPAVAGRAPRRSAFCGAEMAYNLRLTRLAVCYPNIDNLVCTGPAAALSLRLKLPLPKGEGTWTVAQAGPLWRYQHGRER